MDITRNLLDYLEDLSRLQLSEEEKNRVQNDLNSILRYMDKLNELDTVGVEPVSHAIPMVNVYREDIVTNENEQDRILANAPLKKDGAFRVPKTVE